MFVPRIGQRITFELGEANIQRVGRIRGIRMSGLMLVEFFYFESMQVLEVVIVSSEVVAWEI